MKNKKQDILSLLKKEERLSTNKISFKIKASYSRTLELLEELKKEKKVKQNKELMGISWSLNIADKSKVKRGVKRKGISTK